MLIAPRFWRQVWNCHQKFTATVQQMIKPTTSKMSGALLVGDTICPTAPRLIIKTRKKLN